MMKTNTDDEYTLGELLEKMISLLRYLFKKKFIIILFAFVGALIGFILYKVQKPKYEGVCTFILEEKQNGGSLSGLASQFGIDIGNISGGGGLFSGDNILDILKSKKVISRVLLSDVKDYNNYKLVDLFPDYERIKRKWRQKGKLDEIIFPNEEGMTLLQDSLLNVIYKRILKNNLIADRVNKKGTIIKVQVTSENNLFSKYLCERLVDEAGKLYLNIKTGTAQDNINRLQRRSDSLLILLNNKSYQAAATQLLDINPGLKTASVPIEIASRDKTVIGTLYTEVTKNLELSKMMLSQQTPVIQILDKPGLTLENTKKGMVFLVGVSTFLSMFIIISIFTIVYLIKSVRLNINRKQITVIE